MQHWNVILEMCPFSGDALQSTGMHAACTNGARTKTAISGLFDDFKNIVTFLGL
jgi:hypothetical protein